MSRHSKSEEAVMAGDGGRVPDVSEQRAEIEAATRASAPEGLYYSEAKLWFEENPRQASVRVVLERLVRVRRALNAERVPSDPASVLAALLAESPEATVAAIEALGFDRARDGTVAVEDVQSLVNALRRIAYGLEGEMGRYDTPRDDTWWGRIALEALAQFGPARAGESDEGGNQ